MVRRNGKLFSPYSYKGLDDDFDTDNGFSGKIQFGIAVRDSQVADVSGSNAFESDNDANGSSLTPQTSATFSNMTIIGPINSSAPGSINHCSRMLYRSEEILQSLYSTLYSQDSL
jgi:hypothetical protein